MLAERMPDSDIVTFEDIEICADWRQASSPIRWRMQNRPRDDDEWQSTPFQVADAGHEWGEACELVNGWLEMQG